MKKLTPPERPQAAARSVEAGCRIVATDRGARLEQDDAVLSEVLFRPGPTHGVFDVLAASVVALSPGPRLAVLGFAAGGMMAPLRAMGWTDLVEGVDLSGVGPKLFRRTLGTEAGEVRIDIGDAVAWLEDRGAWDVVVEDLSVPSDAGVVKPSITMNLLPGLIRSRRRASGIGITNLLPVPGGGWRWLLGEVADPRDEALVVHLDEFHNRLLVTGRRLPPAVEASRRIRADLRRVGSRQADRLSVRTFRHRD